MKCTNCGGEVDSQAISCPYCGSRNEAGIAFYQEVCRKIQRNRLLAPILLRQQTPELVQRLLTRIILAMGILGVVFLGISLGMYLLMEDPVYSNRRPAPDSYAAEYVKVAEDYYNFEYGYWKRYSNEFLDAWDSGRKIKTSCIERMLDHGFRVYYETEIDAQLQEQARLEVDAMLLGILQLSEEELELFHKADAEYTYSILPDPEAQERLVSLIETKLAIRLEEESGE